MRSRCCGAVSDGACTRRPSPTICSSVSRGDSDEYGSWNTTCTLRRSARLAGELRVAGCCQAWPAMRSRPSWGSSPSTACASVDLPDPDSPTTPKVRPGNRSEEHTSELQSPCNLVCRLLLEKEKHPPPVVNPRARAPSTFLHTPCVIPYCEHLVANHSHAPPAYRHSRVCHPSYRGPHRTGPP